MALCSENYSIIHTEGKKYVLIMFLSVTNMTNVINNFHVKSFSLNIKSLNCSSPEINLFWLWNVAVIFHGTPGFPSQPPFVLVSDTMGCLEERLTLRVGNWMLCESPQCTIQACSPFPSAGSLAAHAQCQLWYGTAVRWDQPAREQVSGYHSVS